MFNDAKIGHEQAGFWPEFSTMDHICTLHAMVEYYKSKKGRVYCAFIDYSNTFDLMDRASKNMQLGLETFLKLYVLLYADDTIISTKTAEEL